MSFLFKKLMGWLTVLILGFTLLGTTQGTAYGANADLRSIAESVGSKTPETLGEEGLARCQRIYDLSRKYGVGPVASEAAAINAIEESGCKEDIHEIGGNGYGAFQYSNETKVKFFAWASANGKDVSSLEAQVEYWWDFYVPESMGYRDRVSLYCGHADKFFSCSEATIYETEEAYKQADELMQATLFFMAAFERPTWEVRHVTENRIAMAVLFEGKFSGNDSGDNTTTQGTADKDSSDNDKVSIKGGTPLDEKDLMGYVEQGAVEGGKDIELLSRDSLSIAEDQALAQHQEYQKAYEISGLGQMIHIFVAFIGLCLVLYGLLLVALGVLDYTNNIVPFPTFKLATFGVYRVVESNIQDGGADFTKGLVTIKGALAIALTTVLLGMALAGGVFYGVFARVWYWWF